jgi:hyperosmotically inducible periplasmic protein
MTMVRSIAAFLLTISFMSASAFAQDGPIRRAGQALDNAGKSIRNRVETEIARGQITAQEREVLGRVSRRIEWDKRFVGCTIRLESRAGGVVVLRGSVLNDAAKLRAVEVVENTIGVTSVVDELAVVKEVKVIKAKPEVEVIEVTPPVPSETKVIVKP